MSRPRDRASAAGLLPRMEARPLKGGGCSYRYHPVGGKPIPLGRDKLAAIRQVLELLGRSDDAGTLAWVWQKFTEGSTRWKRLSEATQTDYRAAWKQIERVFGKVQISAITSPMVARYVHIERAEAPKRANTEKALLSNLFGHGIKLGVCTVNATIGVEPHVIESRTEAPDPAVLERFLAWLDKQTPQRRIVGMAAEYMSLAGSRKVEFLPLTWLQVDRPACVVRTFRAKQRGKKRGRVVEVVTISPALGALLDRLAAIRRADCLYVFPTRGNNAYTDRGFKTLWQRCVLQAIKDGALSSDDRFTFHDLRAYYVSRHKRLLGALPDLHANPAVTAGVYDRNTEAGRTAL